MTAIDELKTVIALAGNKRLPHLEAEIFADSRTFTVYLINLCKDYEWYTLPINDYSCSRLAYYYAMHVMRCKWSEAECIINEHPIYYNLYRRGLKLYARTTK